MCRCNPLRRSDMCQLNLPCDITNSINTRHICAHMAVRFDKPTDSCLHPSRLQAESRRIGPATCCQNYSFALRLMDFAFLLEHADQSVPDFLHFCTGINFHSLPFQQILFQGTDLFIHTSENIRQQLNDGDFFPKRSE